MCNYIYQFAASLAVRFERRRTGGPQTARPVVAAAVAVPAAATATADSGPAAATSLRSPERAAVPPAGSRVLETAAATARRTAASPGTTARPHTRRPATAPLKLVGGQRQRQQPEPDAAGHPVEHRCPRRPLGHRGAHLAPRTGQGERCQQRLQGN